MSTDQKPAYGTNRHPEDDVTDYEYALYARHRYRDYDDAQLPNTWWQGIKLRARALLLRLIP